jgi:hypothetical protein
MIPIRMRRMIPRPSVLLPFDDGAGVYHARCAGLSRLLTGAHRALLQIPAFAKWFMMDSEV